MIDMMTHRGLVSSKSSWLMIYKMMMKSTAVVGTLISIDGDDGGSGCSLSAIHSLILNTYFQKIA